MAASNQFALLSRNRNIILALCKSLCLDPRVFLDDIDKDLKILCVDVLKSSQSASTLDNNDELMKWINFAQNYPVDSEGCLKVLNDLNGELMQKSVLVGGRTKTSAADNIVFSAIYSSVVGLSDSDRKKLPHLMRWIDYVQNIENISELFEQITVTKAPFELPVLNVVAKAEVATNVKKNVQGAKDVSPSEVSSTTKKNSDTKEAKGSQGVAVKKKETAAEKKVPEKSAVEEKDKEVSVSLLKIQVGLIRKAWKHPSADSLLVEEIDVGEAKLRQVVSGLAKYCTPDELTELYKKLMTNRR